MFVFCFWIVFHIVQNLHQHCSCRCCIWRKYILIRTIIEFVATYKIDGIICLVVMDIYKCFLIVYHFNFHITICQECQTCFTQHRFAYYFFCISGIDLYSLFIFCFFVHNNRRDWQNNWFFLCFCNLFF